KPSADQARRHQLPQRGLHLRLQLSAAAHNVGKERCPALAQKLQHLPRRRRKRPLVSVLVCRVWQHPLRIVANKKSDRRHAGRDHPPPAIHPPGLVTLGAAFLQRRRMRREPPPADRPRQAELIERCRIVVAHPPREHLPLPCIGWNLESLQLPKHLQQASLAGELRPLGHVLPAQQPAHELRLRYRLDLPPQPAQGQPVNARQQPPLAKFNSLSRSRRAPRHPSVLGWRPRLCLLIPSQRHVTTLLIPSQRSLHTLVIPSQRGSLRFEAAELPPQHRPRGLQPHQRLLHLPLRQLQHCRKLRGCDRSGMTHPSRHQREHGLAARLRSLPNLRQRRLEDCLRINRLECLSPLRRYPEAAISRHRRHRCPPRRCQFRKLVAPRFPCPRPSRQCRIGRQRNQRVEHVLQFVCIAHIRPRLLLHLRNRLRIE